MTSKLRIAIVSIYAFPFGGAASSRILAYSKGLVANGAEVDVYVIVPTENYGVGQVLPNAGNFQSIKYYYTSGRYRNRFKLLRAISILSKFRQYYGYYTSFNLIRKNARNNGYSSIIISTDLIPAIAIYSYLSKLIAAKSIFIFDEFPTPIRHKLKNRIPFWKENLYRMVLKRVDAFVSISIELKNYYCSLASKPTFILPVIVDFSRFSSSVNHVTPAKKYMCYMGNMELTKDDVDNIIKAFQLIIDEFPDIELHLYGSPIPETRIALTKLIDSLGLNNHVFMKGRVSSELVPEIINNAYLLVSSQPDTKRASGGFPTKLGEYLSTGIPSLLTNVGENSKYVKDREHVFLANPNDPKNYAECLKYIISNYQEALQIARNGQAYVLENYSHVVQGKHLHNFISKL